MLTMLQEMNSYIVYWKVPNTDNFNTPTAEAISTIWWDNSPDGINSLTVAE